MNKIQIIKEPTVQKPFIVIYKPAGLPTAPLNAEDKNNAFYEVTKLYPEVLEVKGKKEIEHGLLHRIDTATSGLVVISCTQTNYNDLLQLQANNKITKFYMARTQKIDVKKFLEGFPELDGKNNIEKEIQLTSYFRAFGEGRKCVRPVTEKANAAALKKLEKKVLYTTKIQLNKIENQFYTFDCNITNGYRHQVRCHLAWLGFPIIGDSLYNPDYVNKNEKLEFTAYKIDINGDVYSLEDTKIDF